MPKKTRKTPVRRVAKGVKNKPKKIERNYSPEDLLKAVNLVREGMKMYKAAMKCNVPKTTLSRKIHGYENVGARKGPSTVLTQEEEDDLVTWILYNAAHGEPVSKRKLLDCVKKYVISKNRKTPFTNGRPGKHWYQSFMKRHPNLSERVAQSLTKARASVCEQDIRTWFSKIKENHEKKHLLNIPPERIFNLDESAFQIVPSDNVVLAEKGAKFVYKVASTDKTNVTILTTISAAGKLLPPMMLFNLKYPPKKQILEKIPSHWEVGNTEKGWMTAVSFFQFIKNIFHKWLTENNVDLPVILYADKHTSHFSPEVLRFCRQKCIELTPLYPNSTHFASRVMSDYLEYSN